MEGSMDKNGNKLSDESEVPTELKLENTVDTSGMWFAAAVVFAVLAAGVIIYRAVTIFARRRMIHCPRRLQVRDSSRTLLKMSASDPKRTSAFTYCGSFARACRPR